MNKNLSMSKIILFCLMVSPIFVDAGERNTPCKRFFALFSSIAFLFSPQSQAQSLVCVGNGGRGLLHESAFRCDSGAVSHYLEEGYSTFAKANCYYTEKQKEVAFTTTSENLIVIRGIGALNTGDFDLFNDCTQTMDVLKVAAANEKN